MLSTIDKLRYRGQHFSFLLNATVLQEAARIVTRQKRPELSRDTIRELMTRHKALHRRDLENVATGMYPRELLFDIPVQRYLRAFPQLVRDIPSVVRRMRSGDYKELPEIDKARYPAYYRRTFHWQTDGYFSEHSAELYELGVELLFRGTADVMRRQVIPPITRFANARPEGAKPLKLIDIACGTGRTLHQIARTHPTMRLTGVDLSPAYVRIARERLRDVGELTMHAENAEHLPYADGTFDIATSVYLFHELPRNARRNVVREMFRVVSPGGLVVIEDSAQLADSGVIEHALRNFPAEFHEPFYADYLEDDLAQLLAECGFVDVTSESHLVARVVSARRP